VMTFTNCFSYCYSLTSIPSGLFDNTTEVTNFATCFSNCTGLTSIPSGLFNYTSGANNFTNCFYGVTLSTESYSNLLINLDAYNPNSNVPFHGGNSKHNSSATGALASLSGRGWTITDGGLE